MAIETAAVSGDGERFIPRLWLEGQQYASLGSYGIRWALVAEESLLTTTGLMAGTGAVTAATGAATLVTSAALTGPGGPLQAQTTRDAVSDG